MDLRKLMQAFGRRWYVLLIGVVLGCALAFVGMYRVSVRGPESSGSMLSRTELTQRSFKTYKTVLAVVIDAPNAALGRTDVPIQKTVELAPTYAYLATDDTVMRTLESKYGRPLQAKVTAVAVDGSPIVQVTVEGKDPDHITEVAATAQKAFIAELETYQKDNQIPESLRIVVRPLGPPSQPELVISRQYEILAVLFLMPVILFAGLALVADNWGRAGAASGATTDGRTTGAGVDSEHSVAAGAALTPPADNASRQAPGKSASAATGPFAPVQQPERLG